MGAQYLGTVIRALQRGNGDWLWTDYLASLPGPTRSRDPRYRDFCDLMAFIAANRIEETSLYQQVPEIALLLNGLRRLGVLESDRPFLHVPAHVVSRK